MKMDEEITYFRDIERAFVERRGDPLFISNADWFFLARLWKKRIPLRVVLRGITDAFDAHAFSFARKQKIRSLAYCQDQITAAVDRYRRALQVEGPSPRGLSAAIETFGANLGGSGVPAAMDNALAKARLALRDVATAVEEDKSFDAEKAFTKIEDNLVKAASAALAASDLLALEEATRTATAAYKSRMPATVYETLIGESVRRKILQHFGLPRILLAEIE